VIPFRLNPVTTCDRSSAKKEHKLQLEFLASTARVASIHEGSRTILSLTRWSG